MKDYEARKAKERQAEAGKANLPNAHESWPIGHNWESGRTIDKLAAKSGVGAKTVQRAITRAVRRATEVCQEARDLIRGTKLDTGTLPGDFSLTSHLSA